MKTEKEIFFDNATQRLMEIADALHTDKTPLDKYALKKILFRLRGSMKSKVTHELVFPNTPNRFEDNYYSAGFCGMICAIIYEFSGAENVWTMMYINRAWEFGPHVFLRQKFSGIIFDPTFDQYSFKGIEIKDIPYNKISQQVSPNIFQCESVQRFAKTINYNSLKELQTIEMM